MVTDSTKSLLQSTYQIEVPRTSTCARNGHNTQGQVKLFLFKTEFYVRSTLTGPTPRLRPPWRLRFRALCLSAVTHKFSVFTKKDFNAAADPGSLRSKRSKNSSSPMLIDRCF